MGYPFFILSIYIIIFFLLCLTCFSLDDIYLEDEGNLEDEERNIIPIENEFGEVRLNENINLHPSGNLRRCLTKENVLNGFKIILESFFLGGLSVDGSLLFTYAIRKDQLFSIITSFMSIGLIFIIYFLTSYVFRDMLNDPVEKAYAYAGVFTIMAVLYISTELWNYLLVRKYIAGRINAQNKLLIISGFARLVPAFILTSAHVVYTFYYDINLFTRNMWLSVILASSVSLFFLICSVFTYCNYRKRSARILFYMSSLIISHTLVTFAQVETVLSMFLFSLSKEKPTGSILLSMLCYILISLLSFFQEKNADFYVTSSEEVQPLVQYIRLNTVKKSNNNDNTLDTEEGRSRCISAEELCTDSIH